MIIHNLLGKKKHIPPGPTPPTPPTPPGPIPEDDPIEELKLDVTISGETLSIETEGDDSTLDHYEINIYKKD